MKQCKVFSQKKSLFLKELSDNCNVLFGLYHNTLPSVSFLSLFFFSSAELQFPIIILFLATRDAPGPGASLVRHISFSWYAIRISYADFLRLPTNACARDFSTLVSFGMILCADFFVMSFDRCFNNRCNMFFPPYFGFL